MKVSLNTLKFTTQRDGSADPFITDTTEVLAKRIGAQLGAIETITDLSSKYDGVLIVKVVACIQHEGADRLHVCKLDDGHKAPSVERDEQGFVQVVCGASNVRAGMLAVWLPPGVVVPNTRDKDPLTLEVVDLRGQRSHGMLASPKELGLSDSHNQIAEVDVVVEPGSSFAEVYHLADDSVLDIENKMFTHRPDCFGFLGIAREIAGIQQRAFKSPAWYTLQPVVPLVEGEPLPIAVRNEVPELVPRFCAMVLRDVSIGPSPIWLQVELSKVGLRPINNLVDYANFFMLQSGQPLHVYDYDKVKAASGGSDQPSLVVRQAQAGEQQLLLLNGKEVHVQNPTIVIATETQPIGIGGVMGGKTTEVDEHTKHIIIECADFDMYSIRRTSMQYGLFTDAVVRFSKGQSPLQIPATILKLVDEIRRTVGGKVASPLIDDSHLPADMTERGAVHPPVSVTRGFVNTRLGLDLATAEMTTLLKNVEFDVQASGEELTIKAPFWRTDIALPEDIVEEIGRLYGYDKFPLVLPARNLTPAPKDQLLELRARIRRTLSAAGANEVLTYSFVHGNLLDTVGQSRDQAFRLANALSPDLQYYRLSLTPSLLEKVYPNLRAGYDDFALFELGKVHAKSEFNEDGLPRERQALSLVVATNNKTAEQYYAGSAYYRAKRYLFQLLRTFGIERPLTFEPLATSDLSSDVWTQQQAALFEPARGAVIRDHSGAIWGILGEFIGPVRYALKLPEFCAGLELDLQQLQHVRSNNTYRQLPRFPNVEQDICFKLPVDVSYQQLEDVVTKTLFQHRPLHSRLTTGPIDIYQRDGDVTHKQITLRIALASYERTLTDAVVSELLDQVAAATKAQLQAERI